MIYVKEKISIFTLWKFNLFLIHHAFRSPYLFEITIRPGDWCNNKSISDGLFSPEGWEWAQHKTSRPFSLDHFWDAIWSLASISKRVFCDSWIFFWLEKTFIFWSINCDSGSPHTLRQFHMCVTFQNFFLSVVEVFFWPINIAQPSAGSAAFKNLQRT